jgi:Type VI secretion system/phage-baseplate injector OB domain
MSDLLQRVRNIEQTLLNQNYQNMSMIQTEAKKRWRLDFQPERLDSLLTAVCVDTKDPLKQGRVRFYHPAISQPDTPVDALPWAWPVTNFGGFDDSGATWVPPAGSKVCLLWEYGNRDSPYYIGTTWDRDRGPAGNHFWNYPVQEYQDIWEGKRNGYLVGTNDREVYPSWNTESYNGKDIISVSELLSAVNSEDQLTAPNIYGFKTNEKHALKMVDGDYKCNRRAKRLELFSSCGNWLMFKDDHLHPAGQWAFGSGLGDCTDLNATCGNSDQSLFTNPFFKRKEEMRPYIGPNTPQANRCELNQSGIWMQSISGHQLVFDDSVEEPQGVPSWDREFDFGCTDTFQGKFFLKSATGHVIEISDVESSTGVRSQDNYIRLKTASGISLELNDHTESGGVGGNCPPNIAGSSRGVTIETSSLHTFQMIDEGNQQCSPERTEGGVPVAQATNGYCLLRSGYGLQLLLADEFSQQDTQQQYIQLLAPQKTNIERGPHMLSMQEQASGPGTVMLRAGGVYFQMSYDDSIEMVGDSSNANAPPASKFMEVTDSYFIDVRNTYFNHSSMALFEADTYIMLLAGKDCVELTPSQAAANALGNVQNAIQGNPTVETKVPCPYPVIVAKEPWVCPYTGYVHFGVNSEGGQITNNSMSDRVFGSTGDWT